MRWKASLCGREQERRLLTHMPSSLKPSGFFHWSLKPSLKTTTGVCRVQGSSSRHYRLPCRAYVFQQGCLLCLCLFVFTCSFVHLLLFFSGMDGWGHCPVQDATLWPCKRKPMKDWWQKHERTVLFWPFESSWGHKLCLLVPLPLLLLRYEDEGSVI